MCVLYSVSHVLLSLSHEHAPFIVHWSIAIYDELWQLFSVTLSVRSIQLVHIRSHCDMVTIAYIRKTRHVFYCIQGQGTSYLKFISACHNVITVYKFFIQQNTHICGMWLFVCLISRTEGYGCLLTYVLTQYGLLFSPI